jgi:tetratricopeptide (TPR) repeat protein
MFCKKCGKESTGNQKFCTGCGAEFSKPAESATQTPPQPSAVKRPPMRKEPWTAGRIIKAVVAVIFVGGLIFLKFGLGAINSIDSTAVDKNNSAQEAYQAGGDPNQAISQLQQASQDAVTNSTKMTTKVNLAYVYSSEGKNDLALATFKEALPLASEGSVDYYLISGEIALLEGKPNSALLAYNKAYEKDPNDFQVNNALNLFYLDIADERPQYSNPAKALTYALKADQIQPSDITKQNLGIAYHLNEKYSQAISTFLTVSNITGQPYLAYWLGLAYAGDQQPTNAKYYLRIAINGGVPVPQEVKDYIANN